MKSIFLTLCLLVFALHTFAQKAEADEKYHLFQYAKAIPLYEKYLEKNPKDYKATLNLATAYKLVNDIPKAIQAYKSLIQMPESGPEDLLQIVQLMQIEQQITEARQYAIAYQQKQPGEKADNLIRSLDSYNALMATQHDYSLVNKTKQYPFSVLSVYPYNDKLIVTAETRNDNSNKWTGRSFTDLYITDAAFGKLDKYAANLMTPLDDGIPTFSNDFKTLYFTSVNKESIKEGDINTRKLHIMIAQQSAKGDWQNAVPFSYNSNSYNTAHPTLSPDGQVLVFASDMPGGKGGMDLYMCTRAGEGWSAPVNIKSLNTYGNEIFPVFQDAHQLVYATNGLPGLGGLDLFVSKFDNNTFGLPENLKAPLNSSYDDYCLITTNNFQSGYLTSNRDGNTQIDNVFHFEKAVQQSPVTVAKTKTLPKGLKIKVVDKYTKTPLPYVSVKVKQANGEIIQQGLSDENGMIEIDEIPMGSYTIQGILNDVTTSIATVDPEDFKGADAFIYKEVNHNDPRFTLKGIVVNAITGKPLEGVKVICANQTLGKEREIVTTANGTFFFQLEQKSDFKVSGQKNKWLSSETAEATTIGLDRSKELYVTLQLSMQEPVANATIRLKKIFYSYDKCDIRPQSALELDRLLKLLNDYPDMIIELSSHTDSRGSDAYNMKLSQCRADAASDYLISKGLSKSRFTAKGYGETMLVNGCKNGVSCTDIQHEENRRTEFRIISCATCPALSN